MLTLIAMYVLAIAVGCGAAVINDLFFFLSLKHHILKKHEIITLRQLLNIKLVLLAFLFPIASASDGGQLLLFPPPPKKKFSFSCPDISCSFLHRRHTVTQRPS